MNGIVFFLKLYSPPVDPFPSESIHDELTKQKPLEFVPVETLTGFYFRWESASFWGVQFPYWFPATLSALFTVLPWFGRPIRFRLRTLLIATTLVAVALGVIAWARH